MISLDKERAYFFVFILVLLVATGLCFGLGGAALRAYAQAYDEQLRTGCLASPSGECAELFRDFCVYRPFRGVILVSGLALYLGGPVGLLILRQFASRHRTPFIVCLSLFLAVLALLTTSLPEFLAALEGLSRVC
jgi:hypothetical protein